MAGHCGWPPHQHLPFHLLHGVMPDMAELFSPHSLMMLRSGTVTLSLLTQDVEHGILSAGYVENPFYAQSVALHAWQQAACSREVQGDNAEARRAAAAAYARAYAPPELRHEWLHCSLSSSRLLQPPSWKSGGQRLWVAPLDQPPDCNCCMVWFAVAPT